MTSTPSTQPTIQRSWPATFRHIGLGCAFALASVLIFKYTNFGLMLGTFAVVLLIFAVVFFYMSYDAAGTGPCPGCGKMLDGLSLGTNDGVACEGCHKYYEGNGGKLWATDETRVADTPLFASPLPEPFRFPEGCCVCGKPATHDEKVTMATGSGTNAALAGATGIVRTSTSSVEVPHCDEHKGGADLAGANNATRIKFRSYPYLRAFCELNGTQPG